VYIAMMITTSLTPICQFPSTLAHMVAVRASDGALLWQTIYEFGYGALAANGHAVYGTTTMGTVVGFDAHTGQPLATFPDNGASYFPTPGAVKGEVVGASEQLVLIEDGHGLQALSAVDEHVLWTAPVDFVAAEEFASAAHVTDNLVIGAGGTGLISAVRVRDGSIAWHLPRFGDHGAGTLSVTQGVVFTMLTVAAPEDGPCLFDCTPSLIAFDATTGSIYWLRDTPGAQMIVATDQP
jgi:outer membrane protein assembly factor BamB